MKPILKWEIDSIQAVIDEEKENRQGIKLHKIIARIFNARVGIFTAWKAFALHVIFTSAFSWLSVYETLICLGSVTLVSCLC